MPITPSNALDTALGNQDSTLRSVRKLTKDDIVGRGLNNKRAKLYAARLASVSVDIVPIGDPPKRLRKTATEVWSEFAPMMPTGVLSISDRAAFECFCNLMARQRLKPDAFSHLDHRALLQYIVRFGMTPADRSRIIAGETIKSTKETDFDFDT